MRTRVARRAPADTAMRIQISGECMDASNDALLFAREGMFGVAQRGGLTVEAAFDEGLDFRVSAPFLKEPARIMMTLGSDGTYSGSNQALTSCGWKTLTMTASAQ